MASNLKATLQRHNGTDIDTIYPKTTWVQVESKPSTYTPTAHSHGDISDTGTITSTAVTPANTDYILISDATASGKIQRGIALGTGTTTYLRNDGTWVNPESGSGTYAGPTETLLGSRTTDGTLTVADIDDYDEIILELVQVFGTNATLSARAVFPTDTFFHDGTEGYGGNVLTTTKGSATLKSCAVIRNNTAGTSLAFDFSTTGYTCNVYGRNW